MRRNLTLLSLLLLTIAGCSIEPYQPAGGAGIDPIVVTDANFKDVVLNSPEPVLVNFWASW